MADPRGNPMPSDEYPSDFQALLEHHQATEQELAAVKAELDAARVARPEPDIEDVIRQVAELPDRTSPDDWPEAMLVTADELRIILGAARVAPGGASAWQDIATAPKDGTWILAYGIDGTVHRVSWGRTRQDELAWCTAHGWCAFRYLTHWMPLPPPPGAPDTRP